MEKIKTSVRILFLILFFTSIFLGLSYFNTKNSLNIAQESLDVKIRKEKIIDFTKLFIEKVLVVEGEVNFETRLELENAVRALEDEEIKQQWQKFIESSSEEDAQGQVKVLLSLLMKKI